MDIKILKNKNFIYKAQENENLTNISNKFKINEAKLIHDNKLISKVIEKGDVLFIENENNIIYTVKPLDNLLKISQKFKVSISFIKEKNNLKSEHIFIGQILVL